MKRRRAQEDHVAGRSGSGGRLSQAAQGGFSGLGGVLFVAVILGVLLLSAALPRASMPEQTAASIALEFDSPLPIPGERDSLAGIVDSVRPCDDVSSVRDVRSRALEHAPRDPCALFDHGPRGPPQFASACI